VKTVLVLDLDVHQGDGTATIFEDDPTVHTCSLHARRCFPLRKQKSDLDVPLQDGMGDAEYMAVLAEILPPLLDEVNPDLVLYDAGVDPHQDDTLGLLGLSSEGLLARDMYVLDQCHGMRGIPIVTVIGGGYTADHVELGARHAIVVDAVVQHVQRIARPKVH
jgi:acetoin utilization deacetylase AcuC-like enzyme